MATGEHVHDWHYNDATCTILTMPYEERWEAVRYCTRCKKVEVERLEK